jgi:hypothetical protein
LLSFHPPKLNGSLGTGTPTFTPIIRQLHDQLYILPVRHFV